MYMYAGICLMMRENLEVTSLFGVQAPPGPSRRMFDGEAAALALRHLRSDLELAGRHWWLGGCLLEFSAEARCIAHEGVHVACQTCDFCAFRCSMLLQGEAVVEIFAVARDTHELLETE